MIQKAWKNITTFTLLLLMLMIVPTLVSAKTETVNTQDQLKKALADSDVDTIVLSGNIDTTEKINITRPIYLDGKGYTIKYTGTFKNGNDKTVWDGIYVLHVYKTNATIKDVKLTGGNAGLLVNGSNVTLRGKIDVSGNGFGGIELSQGANVTEKVKVSLVDDAEIINTTESKDAPTLWVPSDSDDAVLEVNGESVTIKSGEELQLAELKDLFADENPDTVDLINLYLLLGFIGTITFIISYKKLRKQGTLS